MRFLTSIPVFMVAAIVLAACGQAVAPVGVPPPPVAGTSVSAPKAAWEEKWNSVLGEARKEGAVVIYNTWPSETRAALTTAFKDKYGINLEFSAFGNGSQMGAKVQAEQRAGLYLADVFGSGVPTLFSYMRAQSLLTPIRPLLLLPEVLDPNAWREGKMPFADREALTLELIAKPNRTIAYNTNLIKDGEITTYRDLLKPQYRGKIAMLDPSVTGNASIAHLGYNLWGEAAAKDFLRRLIGEQDVAIIRDNRLHIETVARGKYAIAFAPSATTLPNFMAAGAPLKLAMVEEDNRMSSGSGAMGLPRKFAHPNATQVFVNWLLGKEGQSVYAESYGNPSSRLDASTRGIDPIFLPEPGKKYYFFSEEFQEATDRWLEIARKIMEEEAK